MRGMRRLLPLLAVGCLAAVGVAPAPARTPRTYASSCGQLRYRPHAIVIACGDGNFGLKHLHWRHWGEHGASGRGLAYANDCDPFCAAGHFHSYRVRVRLVGLKHCHGRQAFRRVRIRYLHHRPAGAPRLQRERLFCS